MHWGMLMLKLKLQYFGHLMQRAESLEKTLMLGKIEGKRRRKWQRMRWSKPKARDFPRGPLVENLPSNAGNGQVLHWKGCQELGAYLSLLAKGTQFPPGLLMQVGGGMTRGLVVLTRGRTCLGG